MQVPIRLGYHYLNSDRTWREQADAYLSFVSGLDYHAHVCDFEDAYNTLSTSFAYDCWKWIDLVSQRTGKPVLLYTGKYTYQDYITPSQKLYGINWDSIPLWIAQYFYIPNPNGTPSLPTGRTGGWHLWQYTDKGNGSLYGTGRPSACDLDVFNGSVEEMRAFLKIGDGQKPPPPTGGTMQGRVISFINIRPGAGDLSADLGDLNTGDVIDYSEKVNVTTGQYPGAWYHITKVTYLSGFVENAISSWWCWGKNIEEIAAPPEGETIAGVRFSGEVVFDWTDGRQEVYHVTDVPFIKGPARP